MGNQEKFLKLGNWGYKTRVNTVSNQRQSTSVIDWDYGIYNRGRVY